MRILKKTLIANMTMIMLSFVLACTDHQADSVQEAENVPVKSEIRSPGIDIHTAAYLGDLNSIRQHIQAGSDLNLKDQYGSTPLIVAITFSKIEVSKALINAGVNLDLVNHDGSTALHVAAFFCDPEVVEILLEKGADKSIRNNYGVTPLEIANGPFEELRPVYDQMQTQLGPLGLKLDYRHMEKVRPKVVALLK